MQIYMAARYPRFGEMQGYRDQLHAAGHTVTARWIEGDLGQDDGTTMRGSPSDLACHAVMDMEDIARADCIISFTEGVGSPNYGRGGRHAEFGMAVALLKRIIVVGPREHVFHWLPNVECFATWAQAIAAIGSNTNAVEVAA